MSVLSFCYCSISTMFLCHRAACHIKSEAGAKYRKNQVVTNEKRKRDALFEIHISLSNPPDSRSIPVRPSWHSGLIPAPSQRNSWFQLGHHFRVYTHSHTTKYWGCLLSFAPHSAKGVIESFDQNTEGAVKWPAQTAVSALRLSIRPGLSSSCSA